MTDRTLRRQVTLGLLASAVLPAVALADKGGKKPKKAKKAKARGHEKGRGRGHEKARGEGHRKHGDHDGDDDYRVRYEPDEDRLNRRVEDYRRRADDTRPLHERDPLKDHDPLTGRSDTSSRTEDRAALDAEYDREFAQIREDYRVGRLEIQRAFDLELDDGLPADVALANYEHRMADLNARSDARFADLDDWYEEELALLD